MIKDVPTLYKCHYKKFRGGRLNRPMLKYHDAKTPKTIWCISVKQMGDDWRVVGIELEIDMIKRSDYTSEMWDKKREIDLAFNALFLKQDFRNFIVSKAGYCPRDLNFDTEFDDDGSIYLYCCMKHYGYDSSCNKGQPFSDLGDYETEPLNENAGEKYLELLMVYVNENAPEFSNKLCELGCNVYY